jgi:hypothetical protein
LLISTFIIPTILIPTTKCSTISIASADSAIQTAFKNVILVQNAGGNVTLLVDRLNLAGTLIADAENILRSDSSINVTVKVTDALTIAEQVNEDALNLLNTQSVNSSNNFWLQSLFP